MPAHRVLLLLKSLDALSLADLRARAEALKSCAGVAEVLVGLWQGGDVRLLSPWLFADPRHGPEDVDLAGFEQGVGMAEARSPELASAVKRSLVANPLSVRKLDALRAAVTRIAVDAAQWAPEERALLEAVLPVMAVPENAGAPEPFAVAGRLREAGESGPIRILALNAVEPAAQVLLGRFIHELGLVNRTVELLDFRQSHSTLPVFWEALHVRALDAERIDQSAIPWHLVIIGRDLPFQFRQFSTLTAQLFLFARPTIMFRQHHQVAASLDASRLTFRVNECRDAPFLVLGDAAGAAPLRLCNADIFTPTDKEPWAPLAALLTVSKAIEAAASHLGALAPAARFRQRFGSEATAQRLVEARLLAHRRYEPLRDPCIDLAIADEIGQLLIVDQRQIFYDKAFQRFLHRPAGEQPAASSLLSLRKRIDILRGIIRSREYARITPDTVAAPIRRVVEELHQAIFSPDSLSAAAPPEAGSAAAATILACRAMVARHLDEADLGTPHQASSA